MDILAISNLLIGDKVTPLFCKAIRCIVLSFLLYADSMHDFFFIKFVYTNILDFFY